MADTRILINTGPSRRGWHRLELAAKCLRLYAMSHLLKIETGTKEPLVRGSLLHIGQAHINAQSRAVARHEDPGRYYNPLDAIEVAAALPEFSPHGPALSGLCIDVTREYMRRYAGERIDVVMVEEVVEAMLGGKYLLTQRWDLCHRDGGGKIWIRDYKSAAKPNASVLCGYSISGQFLAAQLIGRQRYGDAFGGVQLDILGVTPPYKFLRDTTKPMPAALARFSKDMVELEDRLAALAAEGRDPWDYPGAWNEHTCVGRYGPCAYYTLCQWGKNMLD